MAVADVVAQRSLCVRAQIGAVIIDPEQRIVATGYNGPPSGLDVRGPCTGWCDRATRVQDLRGYTDCAAAHAEMNAVGFCDRRDSLGGTIYVTGAMCFTCAKLVGNAGLERVVMRRSPSDEHRDPDRVTSFLQSAGLEVAVL